jgi:urea transport system ATP-binding protein
MLGTKKLTKDFGGFRAVDNVDFYVETGELRCIIGPNGAGKTTLFDLISGFLKPSSGDIYYDNERITELKPHQIAQKGIIRKFQVPNIYKVFTLQDNIRIPCQMQMEGRISLFTRSSRQVEKRITEILELVRLGGRKEELADNVSHGEKQWLELGMTLAMRPSLMLLDEPTQGMTRDETAQTAEIIKDMARVTTIIIIEHDIHFIKEIAKKISVMHNGALLVEGSLDQIESDDRVKSVYLGKEYGTVTG